MRTKRQCRRYRKLIPLLIDGELDEATAAKVEHHLNHCRGCMSELKWQKWLCSILRSMPYMPAPPNFTERTLERIKQLQAQQGTISHSSGIVGHLLPQFVRVPAYAFAVLIALFAGWMAFKMGTSTTSDYHPPYVVANSASPHEVPPINLSPTSTHTQKATANVRRALTAQIHPPHENKAPLSHRHSEGLSVGQMSYPDVRVSSRSGMLSIARSDVNAAGDVFEPMLSAANLRASFITIKNEPRSAIPVIATQTPSEALLSFTLTEIRQLMDLGRLSHAVERLTELIQKAAIGEPIRYRALCLLKVSYERMGEWVLAKSAAEQIASELKSLNDVGLVAWVAQACESDGDSQLAGELYASIAEHATYPTSLRAYAQTRLASLRSKVPNWSAMAPAIETAQAQSAPSSGSERQHALPASPENASPDDAGEHQANGDANFIEDLFKLAEAI